MNKSPGSETSAAAGLDRPLLEAVRRRDAAAMERFFAAYYGRVFGYFVRLADDRELAEDLTQEVFLRLHRSVERLDPERDPSPWVFTVAANLLRDYWRSAEHRRRGSRRELTAAAEAVHPAAEDSLDRLDREQSEACLRRMLGRLAARDRQLLLLRSYGEMGSAALAGIVGISPEAVRQRCSRALKRLGELYRRYCEPERRAT